MYESKKVTKKGFFAKIVSLFTVNKSISNQYNKVDKTLNVLVQEYEKLYDSIPKDDPAFGPLIDCLTSAANLNDPIYTPVIHTLLVLPVTAKCWGFVAI